VTELKRTLKLTEVVFFAAGVILGAGIYTVIGKAAGPAGNMLWLSFAIAALTAVLSLFAYAELVSIFPEAGGEFSFVKQAAGMRWATIVGLIVALSGIVSSATISIGFAGYFEQLLSFPARITALGIIGLIFLVNVIGIKQSSVVNIIFTIIETCGLLFVIWSAAPSAGTVSYIEPPANGVNGLLLGSAICFFAFTGFEDAVKLAEETKDPERTIPKALFIAAIIVIFLYLTLSFLVVSMIPFQELASSESPLSAVVEKRFGHAGAVVIAVVALFSTSNSLLSNMLGASRVLFSFGKASRRFKLLSLLLPGRKTPVAALIIAAAVAALFSLIGEVSTVALITNFFMFITFLIMNLTVIYLRFKKPALSRPYRTPGTIGKVPLPSVLAVCLLLVLMGYAVYGLLHGPAA
jgi:basic amino acid/polyamine antiporter, APA family